MAGNQEEQLEQLPEALERFAKGFERLAQDVLRHRAWEAILYLFFARYYFDKPDPIGAATRDRDFLAGQRREHAQDEAGAKDIERIYEVLFTMIEAAREQRSNLHPDDDNAPVM